MVRAGYWVKQFRFGGSSGNREVAGRIVTPAPRTCAPQLFTMLNTCPMPPSPPQYSYTHNNIRQERAHRTCAPQLQCADGHLWLLGAVHVHWYDLDNMPPRLCCLTQRDRRDVSDLHPVVWWGWGTGGREGMSEQMREQTSSARTAAAPACSRAHCCHLHCLVRMLMCQGFSVCDSCALVDAGKQGCC